MTAYWLPRARRLEALGLSLREIGAAVGRSHVAVWRQLRGVPAASRRGPKGPCDPDMIKRSHIRAAARVQAAETGEDLAALYRRWDVERLDQSRLWDERRRAG